MSNPIGSTESAGPFIGGWVYQGVPYTTDSAKRFGPTGLPLWLARGSLHRAKWSQRGPYTDPQGMYEIKENEALVHWEVKQGTPQWSPPEADVRPAIFAILPINTNFVLPPNGYSPPLLYQYVDPDLSFALSGDDIAVWFAFNRPPEIIGRFREPDDVDFGYGRNNGGSFFPR